MYFLNSSMLLWLPDLNWSISVVESKDTDGYMSICVRCSSTIEEYALTKSSSSLKDEHLSMMNSAFLRHYVQSS